MSRPQFLVKQVIAVALAIAFGGCGGSTVRFPGPPSQPGPLTGFLTRPTTTGPFPAVVLLHTCSGLWGRFEQDWASWFTAEGYVALVVDSFTSRGATNVCAAGSRGPSTSIVAMDALTALDHLQSLDFVKRDRIAVIGWSYGASAVLAVTAYQDERLLGQRTPERRFRAAVAFYPWCGSLSTVTIPTLLLLAGLDNWTPSAECVTKSQRLRSGGSSIDWVEYPGVHHSFDRAEFGAQGINYLGYTQRYAPEAAKEAEGRVRRFLAQNLH